MPEAVAAPLVELRGIEKRFGELRALAGVDLDLRAGEMHALLGENGAGKTTLMNILYGLLAPDGGEVRVDGHPVTQHTSEQAIASGVGMVHQHFKLVPTLTVAENLLVGRHRSLLLRKRDLTKVAERIVQIGERYGLQVDPSAKIWQLSIGEQQRVEILRALDREARVLILDEPTATLTPGEAEQLFPKLRAMADHGAAIVLITHHLDEAVAWADRTTVLRRGKLVASLAGGEADATQLARLMVGEDASTTERAALGASDDRPQERPVDDRAPAILLAADLRVRGNRGTVVLDGCGLRVAAGEIVAVAGVEGNGQAELEEVLLGLRGVEQGRITLVETDITTMSTAERLRAGMALVPSDRYRRGLISGLSVADNLALDRIGEPPYGSRLKMHRRVVLERAVALINRFGIPVSGPRQQAGKLSGGNAQRVVLARALSRELRCLVAAQPTRGLDVGAVAALWRLLERARDDGAAVLMLSTDLEEILALADRCYVIYRGRFVAELARHELDRHRIGLAMGGSVGHEPSPPSSSVNAELAWEGPR